MGKVCMDYTERVIKISSWFKYLLVIEDTKHMKILKRWSKVLSGRMAEKLIRKWRNGALRDQRWRMCWRQFELQHWWKFNIWQRLHGIHWRDHTCVKHKALMSQKQGMSCIRLGHESPVSSIENCGGAPSAMLTSLASRLIHYQLHNMGTPFIRFSL